MAKKQRGGLGRGLDALLAVSQEMTEAPSNDKQAELQFIQVESLVRGRYQPRKHFKQESLEELADSIREQGLIQPILVRKINSTQHEIIAGERRWRAAQMASLDEVPCLVREMSDDQALALALIENIQRENLNPIEEALALQRLMDEFEMTHQQVAEVVGKSRTAVTNLLRLINLQALVKSFLEAGDLEMGHARALLALDKAEQELAARTVVMKKLSVRETERLVRRLQKKSEEPSGQASVVDDPNIMQLQNKLSENLGARVGIQHQVSGKGKLMVQYNSLDELDGILNKIIS